MISAVPGTETVLQDHPQLALGPEELVVECAEAPTAGLRVRQNLVDVPPPIGLPARDRYGQVQVAEGIDGGIEIAAEDHYA